MRVLLEHKDINNKETTLERLDVRAKMLVAIITSIAIIILANIQAQLLIFGVSFIYLLSIRKIKIMLIAYAFITIISFISLGCMLIINQFVNIMDGKSYLTLFIPFIRMATMVNIVLPLVFTSRIQSILTALKSIRLPFFIYLPVAVMVRFIPTFLHDIKQIAETIKIRGLTITPLTCATHPIVMTRLLFSPLLFRSLQTSEELGIAAELKGLGTTNTVQPYKKLVWKRLDTYMIIATLLVIVVAIILEVVIGVPENLRGTHR